MVSGSEGSPRSPDSDADKDNSHSQPSRKRLMVERPYSTSKRPSVDPNGDDSSHVNANTSSHSHREISLPRDAYNFYSHGDGGVHARILVESSVCARILGHGGRRLGNMRIKASATGNLPGDLDAWITRDEGNELRVMHVLGSPDQIAKFLGLVVRSINDEPDSSSGPESKGYTLKILMPHQIMGRLIGSRMANFKDIERKSAASLSADHDRLPASEERIVYIQGVADAIHIAAYYLTTAFIEHSRLLRNHRPLPFNPTSEKLDLKKLDGEHDRTERALGDRLNRSNSQHRNGRDQKEEAKLAKPKHPKNGSYPLSVPPPPSHTSTSEISLPNLAASAPSGLVTAYETAKESLKPSLRQVVRLPARDEPYSLEKLLENILRVTDCSVESVNDGSDTETVEIEGPPEDNALAIFLIYRYLRKA